MCANSGLKQDPRTWFEKLQTTLQSFGFTTSKSDTSLFILTGLTNLVLVYADDILIIGSDEKEVKLLIEQLDAKSSLKYLGEVSYFLGIEVKKTDTGRFLSQSKYIKDLICKTQMQSIKSTRAPLTTGHKFLNYGS